MKFSTFVFCSLSLAAGVNAAPTAVPTTNGGTLVPGITGWMHTQSGDRLGVFMDSRACFFQSAGSPSEGNSLREHAPERVTRGIDGPAALLRECQAMKQRLGAHTCSKVFLGGHNGHDAVGVNDLFYVWPNGNPDSLLNYYLTQGTSAAGSREAALASLASGRFCMLGPAGKEVTSGADTHFTPANPARLPNTDEQRVLFSAVDCLRDLVDDKLPTASVVFSSCGPLSPIDYWQPSSGTGAGEDLCAQLLSDAMGLRVVYNRGICASVNDAGGYDTSMFGEGHAATVPSYPARTATSR